MADEEIISFDENVARDLMRMRQEWRSGALTRANRRRRTPLPPKDYLAPDSGTGGGTGGGGCCCDRMDCLPGERIVDGVTIPAITEPDYYEFQAPSFRCHCDPAADAGQKVKLYPTDDESIWESDPIQCRSGLADAPCDNTATWTWKAACTNTATWTWTLIPGCTNTGTWTWTEGTGCPGGECHYKSIYNYESGSFVWTFDESTVCPDYCGTCDNTWILANPPTGWGETHDADCLALDTSWVLTSQTDADCCTPPYPDFDGSTPDETTTTDCTTLDTYEWVLTSQTDADCCTPDPPDFDGSVADETTTTDCDMPARWELTSQTDADCCTPAEPDFDGETPDETAETECEVEEGDAEYSDSFWRLTIGTIDYYGCNNTKLEFLINDVVVATYIIACESGQLSRGWCATCTNTFHIVNCGPTDCDVQPPSVICLKPSAPPLIPFVDSCIDEPPNGLIPARFVLNLHPGTTTNADECCAPNIPTSGLIMKHHATEPHWDWYSGDSLGNDRITCCSSADNIIRVLDHVRLSCYTPSGGQWRLTFWFGLMSPGSCASDPQTYYTYTVTSKDAPLLYLPDIMAGESIEFGTLSDLALGGTCLGLCAPVATPIVE